MDNNKELHKDKECISCKHLLMCLGKPKNVDACVKYEQYDPPKKD